jgi:SAM-dependent methyltransferase
MSYIVSERFLQNLPSVEWQRRVLQEVYRVLRKGGRFIVCEGSKKGFEALNVLRARMGLETIPETSFENISAIRIDDDSFEDYTQSEIGFMLKEKLGFSTYFVISRVLHPLMVAPSKPRFDSKFNELGRLIQQNMEFLPGYGSNVLWILEK